MHPPFTQLRVARPTDRLDEVVNFYRRGIGFEVLGSFTGHDGYDGVMLGVPDGSVHLEFTHHVDGSPGEAPSDDHLLVLYVPDRRAIDDCARRLGVLGVEPVPPANPYWEGRALTFADPDGWRVVLMHASDFRAPSELTA